MTTPETPEIPQTLEEIEYEYLDKKFSIFKKINRDEEISLIMEMNQMYKSKELLEFYEIKNMKIRNNWRIEYAKLQINRIKIEKRFLHEKIKDSTIIFLALNGADAKIKDLETEIENVEKFDYETFVKYPMSSYVSHNFKQ